MALPPNSFGSTAMRFLVKFNLSTGYFNITDTLWNIYNPIYGFTLVNLKEIFRITFSGSGITSQPVYQNAGWATNDFSAPDLNGTGPVASFNTVALLTDSDGKVLKG